MVRRTLSLAMVAGFALLLVVLVVLTAAGVTASPSDVPPSGTDIYASRRQDGVVSFSNQGIFGPHICIDYGDPFSPLNSPWKPEYYTYKYRILIPGDYPSDILRVELFDPDSINQAENDFTIAHTQAAIDRGFPLTENKSCTGANTLRVNPCLIQTDELDLVDNYIDIDQINPYWLVRIDENRGVGSPPGNGTCGQPSNYTPGYNTQTVYQLFYYRQNPDETITRENLARYTGQVGDGARDNGDHLTDMRWVSPGGTPIFDQPAPVPVDAGSSKTFELHITDDLPSIVTEPGTGNRYVYLDVSTKSGASENGFEIWAGPPNYTDTISSDVNVRNVQITNSPNSHSSEGVTVFALNNLPLNSNFGQYNVSDPIDIPLTYIGPEHAGQTVSVSLYDSDAGSDPPIIFFFDTIAEADWSLTFAVPGQDDPDGVADGVRCLPGSCQTQWISPSYQIQVPTLTNNCFDNPDPQVCTPFYGGRLIARYDAGVHDSYGWEVTGPITPTVADNAGCTAFPIGVHVGARSVTPPDSGGHPYPDAAYFDYPSPPPSYQSFTDHVADVPLLDAEEGTVYKFLGGFGEGNFGWLLWNEGRPSNAGTLAASLTWPGDSNDYVDHNDNQIYPAAADYPWIVRGYVEPADPTDTSLHIDDWVPANTGAVDSTAVREALNAHIDLERVLRLPVWDQSFVNGNNGRYRIYGFALFRLRGYHLSANSGESWLLLEFIRWDTSCGQLPAPPQSVTINGPATGTIGESYPFTATVGPVDTALPVTYTWQATGQLPLTQSGGLTDTAGFTWPLTGTKTITVTADNGLGVVSDTHTITLAASPNLLTGVTIDGHVSGTPHMPYTFTAVAAPITATQPITYVWQAAGQTPMTHTGGLSDTIAFTWPLTGTKAVTVTADNGLGVVSDTHTISLSAAPVPLTGVSIDGPATGIPHTPYTFTAVATPITATQPITYVWQATGQTPITHTDGLSNTIAFTWSLTGTKMVTVTADNGLGVVTDTHTITLAASPNPLTDVAIDGPALGMPHTPYTFTAVAAPITATQPITYLWQATGQTPVTHTDGLSDTIAFTWSLTGTKTITVTADNSVTVPVVATHTISIEPWTLYLPLVTAENGEATWPPLPRP